MPTSRASKPTCGLDVVGDAAYLQLAVEVEMNGVHGVGREVMQANESPHRLRPATGTVRHEVQTRVQVGMCASPPRCPLHRKDRLHQSAHAWAANGELWMFLLQVAQHHLVAVVVADPRHRLVQHR